MADEKITFPVDPDLRNWGSNALRYLVKLALDGHGGYSPLSGGCGLCGIKDTARQILQERGDG